MFFRRRSTQTERFALMERWMESFFRQVYHVAWLYECDGSRVEELVLQTFVQAYRRMNLAHLFLTGENAVFDGFATASRALDRVEQVQGANRVEVSETSPAEEGAENPWREALSNLSSDQRLLWVLQVAAGRSESDLSRIFLLPRRLLRNRIALAWEQLLAVLPDACSHELGLNSLDTQSQESLHEAVRKVREVLETELPVLPESLLLKAWRHVVASAEAFHAQTRHRGPGWLGWSAAGLAVLSIGAVGYGLRPSHTGTHPDTRTSEAQAPATGLPDPLNGLPVNVEAQYVVPNGTSVTSLSHVALTTSGMYLPNYRDTSNSWPSIGVGFIPFSTSGNKLSDVSRSMGTISMVPPMVQQGPYASVKASDWVIHGWNFDVTGSWAIVTVQWTASTTTGQASATQIYGLYLPTGKSGLIQTLGPDGSGQQDVVAVGDNRIVIQAGVTALTPAKGPSANQASANKTGTDNGTGSPGGHAASGRTAASSRNTGSPSNGTSGSGKSSGNVAANQSSGGSGPPSGSGNTSNNTTNTNSTVAGANDTLVTGLPIKVYRLTGTSPLEALTSAAQIPAPFGFMQDPVVLQNGILFQGITGQAVPDGGTSMPWYLVAWAGDLSKFAGPPDDGQAHFVAVGSTEDMWWAETTPNSGNTQDGAWDVLMGPLSADAGASLEGASSLNGPVEWFTAYKGQVAWIQRSGDIDELVVARVQ